MPLIATGTYYRHSIPEFTGNPLIEVIPPLSKQSIGQLMSQGVSATDAERMDTAQQRIQYTRRLLRYFVPLPYQLDYVDSFWSTVLEGYRTRNPLAIQTTETFNALCESIHNGTIFQGDDSFMFSPIAMTLIGTPGTGKGRTLQYFLGRLPSSLIHHTKYPNLYQLLYLWVESPDTDGYMSLLREIYDKLVDATAEAGLPVPKVGDRASRGVYEGAIAVLARKLNLGVLIVDEIQHLVGNKNVDHRTMKFLTGFVNRIGIPVLLIGTWPALAVLTKELRLMRRTLSPGSARFYRLQNGELWNGFINGLFRMQWTRNVVQYDDFVQPFYYHCQGIPDLAVKLMMLTQLAAIRTGTEELTRALVEEVAARHLSIVAPAVVQMRNGRSEDDPVLWDIEPHDFDAYFAALVADVLAEEQRRASRALRSGNAIAARDRAVSSLVAAGVADMQSANALVDDSQARSQELSAPEIVHTVLDKLHADAPAKRSTRKTIEKLAESVTELDNLDLRKIAILAQRDAIEIMDALQASENIVSIADEGLL